MARYIDCTEAIKHLQFDCKAKYPLSYSNGISAAIREIGKLPPADVAPKSEVAREIFAEIETSLCYKFINGEIHLIIREEDYKEYKKKYTEEKE